jgi:hypothetical protein
MPGVDFIRVLRQRVEDPVLGASDQTMGSVLFLEIVEVSSQNSIEH